MDPHWVDGTGGPPPTRRLVIWELDCNIVKRHRSAVLVTLREVAILAVIGLTYNVVMAMLNALMMHLPRSGGESRDWK